MKGIPDGKIDMVLCDPPFGVTSCKWDSVIPLEPMWKELKRIVKPSGAIVLHASQPFTTTLVGSNKEMFKYGWIWLKNVPTGMAQASYQPMKYHEELLVFVQSGKPTFNKQMVEREGERKDCYRYEHYCGENNHVKMDKVKKHYDPELVNPSTVLLFNCVPNRKGKLHPVEKPVPLLEYMINTYTNEGDVVLDFAMGSGSTGIAAVKNNRGFVGIELDDEYFKIAKERINP
jgi:site-specific DNA-methyltransferase (adenine-specific)